MVMGALEDGVVVEVGVGRQAVCPPVGEQGVDDAGGVDGLLHGPALDESAEEGDDIEDLDDGAVLDAQSLDDIQAVDLCEALGGDGQVPGRGGSLATQAAPSIEHAMACENAADGALAGRRVMAAIHKGVADGAGTALAQVALLGQFAAQREHLAFHPGIGVQAGSSTRLGGEIDPVEALVPGALKPALHRREADVETARHLAPGTTTANRADNTAAQGYQRFFSAMMHLSIVDIGSVDHTPGDTGQTTV